MHLSKYIKILRSTLGNIISDVKSNEPPNENTVLHYNDIIAAQWALEKTKDFEQHEITFNRELFAKHIEWLQDNFPDGEQEMQVVEALQQLIASKTHIISSNDGMLYVGDQLLIVHHLDGDVDTIDANAPNMTHLVSSLYDMFQTSDAIHDGDYFSLNGKIIAKCEGVHVVPVQDNAVVILTNYNFGPEELTTIHNELGVKIVDDSGSPHHVVYMGTPENLKVLIRKYWPDYFENEGDIDEQIGDWPYLATWGEGYGDPATRLVPSSFFNSENGYSLENQTLLQVLAPGRTLDLSDLSGLHRVKRLY